MHAGPHMSRGVWSGQRHQGRAADLVSYDTVIVAFWGRGFRCLPVLPDRCPCSARPHRTPPSRGRWAWAVVHGLPSTAATTQGRATVADGANAAGKWPPCHRFRCPLAEWVWTREDCEQVILSQGLPLPLKSACWMCPASKRGEVDWLAPHIPPWPKLRSRWGAGYVRVDLTSTQGIGRRWSWSEHLGYGNPRARPDLIAMTLKATSPACICN